MEPLLFFDEYSQFSEKQYKGMAVIVCASSEIECIQTSIHNDGFMLIEYDYDGYEDLEDVHEYCLRDFFIYSLKDFVFDIKQLMEFLSVSTGEVLTKVPCETRIGYKDRIWKTDYG